MSHHLFILRDHVTFQNTNGQVTKQINVEDLLLPDVAHISAMMREIM